MPTLVYEHAQDHQALLAYSPRLRWISRRRLHQVCDIGHFGDGACLKPMFDLDVAIQKLNQDHADHPSAVELVGVYNNLLRRWAEL